MQANLIGGGQLNPTYFTHEEIATALYVNAERNKLVPSPGSYSPKDDYGRRIFQLPNPITPSLNYGGLGDSSPNDLVARTRSEKPSSSGPASQLSNSLLQGNSQQAANAQYQ